MACRTSIALAAALLALSVDAGHGAQPKTYYLALGDSLAYGVQPDKVERRLPPSAFNTGYVDVVAKRLRASNSQLAVVNYSCPGDTTVTFTKGRCPWLGEGGKLHDVFRGTQMGAALELLRQHSDRVRLVTLTLWGNDVLEAFSNCEVPVECARTRAPKVIASIETRLRSIVRRLHSAAPRARLIVTGAWNFDDESPQLTRVLFIPLNAAMARATAAGKGRFANLLPFFNPTGGGPADKARLCTYTFICSKNDVHPTDAGYRAIANRILAVSGYS